MVINVECPTVKFINSSGVNDSEETVVSFNNIAIYVRNIAVWSEKHGTECFSDQPIVPFFWTNFAYF